MSGLSRRDFFRRFSHEVSDQIDLVAVKSIFKTALPEQKKTEGLPQALDEWFVVGRSIEMSPGAVVQSQLGTVSIALKSNSEGIWAVNDGGTSIALRTGVGGAILANLSLEWPSNRVLSHATGEAIDLHHNEGDSR